MQEHPENIQNQNREPKSWRAEFWERKFSKLWMKKLRFLLSTLKLARSTLRSCAGRRNVEKILFYSFVAELLLTAEVFWVSVQWIIYTNWSIYHSWLWSNSSVNRDQLLLFYNIHIKAAFGRELLFYTTRQLNSRAASLFLSPRNETIPHLPPTQQASLSSHIVYTVSGSSETPSARSTIPRAKKSRSP